MYTSHSSTNTNSYSPLTLLLLIAVTLFSIISFVRGDSGIPKLISELLEEKGITVEDLKKDSEHRQQLLKQLREVRGLPTQHKGRDEVENQLDNFSHTGDLIKMDDFYKVIISNNLFRPLGYAQSKSSTPPFELIATVIEAETGKGKALILSNRNRKVHYVTVGQEFADAKVEQIKPRKVTLLYDGKLKEFHASKTEFLNIDNRGNSGNERVLSSIRRRYSGFAR